jgi:hypothetical protein
MSCAATTPGSNHVVYRLAGVPQIRVEPDRCRTSARDAGATGQKNGRFSD